MTKPMTPERLKAIKDRHEALTKGTYPMRFYPLLSKDLPDCLAEIERLKDLVKAAYREGGYGGFHQGFGDCFDEDNNKWNHSKARKALEGTDAGD